MPVLSLPVLILPVCLSLLVCASVSLSLDKILGTPIGVKNKITKMDQLLKNAKDVSECIVLFDSD